jgi:hypothetical protein
MTNVSGRRFPWPARAHGPLGLLPLVALQLGCYQYVPADLTTVPVGGRVRAVVNGTAADRLRSTYGVADPTLDGRVVARDGDVLTLAIASLPLGSALGTHGTLYQEIPVAAADVVGAEVRRVDAFRTGALVAVSAAAATVIAVRAFHGSTGGTGSGTGGGPTESRRPWTIHVAIPLP